MEVKGTNIEYSSPTLGEIKFGWTGPFQVKGVAIPLRKEKRYDNPYVKAPLFPEKVKIECEGNVLIMDYKNAERIIK